ncbi:MAG: hypothetical protein FJZ56_05290 [Chlamydiae bacterium]|nr:hypothetical protein [Chlamydiota bacterium]
MNKQVKAAIWVVGIAVGAYFLWFNVSFLKGVPQEEKDNLFRIASGGLRRGARTSPDIQEQIQKQEQEALMKIERMGLLGEYEAFKKSRDNTALPQ